MNNVLFINKPVGMTSFDVCFKLRKVLNTKKIGHTGTLDPIATGVLVITIGKYTKLCDILTSEYKEYIATMKLGIETDTLDITGNIINNKDYDVNEDRIKEVLDSFVGKSIQEVPKYSAIKVNGKRLYEYARNDVDVELPKREIDIKYIDFMSYKDGYITFKTCVSKGTYIRSLIRDIAYKLNTVASMSSLIRTKQGIFNIEDSYTIEDIENNNYKLLDIEDIFSDIEIYNLEDKDYKRISNGCYIDNIFNNDKVLVKYKDKSIGLYILDKDKNVMKPYIMF
jgi:tRNA pseudouridine55 synthase